MTPAYLAARVEVRERRALSEYRTARAIHRYHVWGVVSGGVNLDGGHSLREALVARARWSYLHDLQREPERTTDSSLLEWGSALAGDAR